MVKKSKKSKVAKFPFVFLIITIGLFTISGIFIKNVITINNLGEEKTKKEDEYKQLQEESEYLKNEIVKLNDPEYLAKFARENYDYSKDGELVIKIDKNDEKKESIKTVSTENEMKNIIYISGVLLVVISVVFLISLKKRNN